MEEKEQKYRAHFRNIGKHLHSHDYLPINIWQSTRRSLTTKSTERGKKCWLIGNGLIGTNTVRHLSLSTIMVIRIRMRAFGRLDVLDV